MARPRSASLRVQHARGCPNYTKSALDSTGSRSGCTCKPRFYTFHRVRRPDGKLIAKRGPTIGNRKVAERQLRTLLVDIDEDRAGFVDDTPEVTFGEWAETFVGILVSRNRKATTIRSYEYTIARANRAFGGRLLSEIGNPELREFSDLSRRSDATLAMHLRQLGSIFQAAVDDDLIEANPVRKFRKALQLRIPKGDEPYTDAELEALWATMAQQGIAPVYLAACKTLVTTGLRAGELIGLDWRHLDLTNGRLRVERTYSPEDGFTLPKDNEARTVHLIPPAVHVLEDWIAVCGVQPDDSPIFAASDGDRLYMDYLSRLVRTAAKRAGIPSIGEGGRKRKALHAFRATYTRLCREGGLDPQWVQTQLGHSDPALTLNVYGKWSEAGLRAEAAKLDPDAFPV
jgi:integrase